MKSIFPQGTAYIDDKFIDISEAKIPVLDWGFLRSDATYDVVHVWNGRFFLLENHIDRFFNSAKKLRMPCSLSKKKLREILAKCVQKSGLKNSYVEMIQTRGMSPTFDRDPRKANPRFIAFAVPFGWILKPDNLEEGLSVYVTDVVRIPQTSIDPTIKNYHWLDLISGMFSAYDNGHQIGVLVDEKKNILEGPGFNIFSLDDDGLHTPEKGVLRGVTRGAVINIARILNIPVNLNSISLKKFISSKEVFITSTAGGIMPVTKINEKKIGGGNLGKVTKKIYDLYWDKHHDPDWSVSVKDLAL
jgi:branched-chain amino acid aminotransferase